MTKPSKMGRPLKSAKPLNVDIKIRIDEETDNRLKEYASKHSMSRTDVVRKGIQKVLDE